MFTFPKNSHMVAISPASIILGISFVLGLYVLFLVRGVVALTFLAFILMTALHPLAKKLNGKLKLPWTVAIVLAYALFLVSFGLMLALIVPPLGSELYQLVKVIEVPFLQEEITNIRFTVSEISNLVSQVGSSVNLVFSIVSSTFSSMFTFFTLILLSMYIMVDRPYLHKKVAWFSKNAYYQQTAKELLDDLELQLGGWVRGQIILMVLIGAITYVGLLLLGVPYALPLALLAGLFEIVPNLGPTVAAVPAIIFAYMSGGPVLAGFATLFYVVIQQLENNLIVPRIMQQNADVNPLISIVVMLIGLKLAGIPGVLLAVPSYIVVRALYSHWFHRA